MTEEDPEAPDSAATLGLAADDVKPGLYEGGFKTWECSEDLANYLNQNSRDLGHSNDMRFIEVSLASCFVGSHADILQAWSRYRIT
jgi:hypothetical protein